MRNGLYIACDRHQVINVVLAIPSNPGKITDIYDQEWKIWQTHYLIYNKGKLD